ncbi:MAG: glycosyltransferase [Flavobacteriales bacterium]|nr:glycosyltransferase [Flavobacteriales bacterium]
MYTERKNILVLTDWFLPGYKAGGPIRSLANLVSAIREIDFFIVTSDRDHHATAPYDGIAFNTWTKFSDNVQVYYASGGQPDATTWKKLFTERNYSHYYFNSLFSRPFTLRPLRILRSLNPGGKVVLAPRGMLQPGALGIKPVRKKIFLALCKAFGFFKGIRWHATSQAEALAIQNYLPSAEVHLAPNLASTTHRQITHPPKSPGLLKLLTIARYSPEKGIRESIEYLRTVDGMGDVTLHIYGTRQNEAYLNECQKAAENFRTVKVHFNGEIHPDEIPSALSNAHFFYSATLGENFGHAIAEALINGVPVIITNLTPWKNLSAQRAGFDLASEPDIFRQVLQQCIEMDNISYSEWTACAFNFGQQISQSAANTEACLTLFDSGPSTR